ncbi:hypothetical protein JF535_13410 [Microbulbifer salipaludis]|uniref:Uncharacterized protein n=1 Tax=Microbulbifer salipaludis TaxID=187980 RepID=A0ABS3E973_9GAMM|nr:hypothetical protein [Microbulbifer salipaludis]MBN8431850.1 hypothetical protein [Microbulbifer salipaludis]
MTTVNIEDVNPLRRNLIVICLIILVYVLGGGSFEAVGGVEARLGLVGVAIERPYVIKLAALFVFVWSWYRYLVFDKTKTHWDHVVAHIRQSLREGAGKPMLDRAIARVHGRHISSAGSWGAVPGSLVITPGRGGFFAALIDPWEIKNTPLHVSGKHINGANEFSLGWREYLGRIRFLVQAMYYTEYLPSVALPYALAFSTLLAVLSPLYAYAYSQFGAPVTVGVNALFLAGLYWRECFGVLVSWWRRRPAILKARPVT